MKDPIIVPPDYDMLLQALARSDSPVGVAEAHGIITGALCVTVPPNWQVLILGQERSDPVLAQMLSVLYRDTENRLAGTEFDFTPILPEDEPLTVQVEALGDWCRGLMLGLATGGITDITHQSGTTSEFLSDLMNISEVEPDSSEDESRQERDLAEIVEYIRAGVQLLYEEAHHTADTDSSS